MNKMELVKFKQTLQHPQGKLNYLDKELSSYIFLQFNLSNVNFTTQLLETIFDKDLLLKLLNSVIAHSWMREKTTGRNISKQRNLDIVLNKENNYVI